ncbi:MAG: 50S ribosomal protein L17 [candidate division WS6 bacterium 36_33]|uniref:50S ribosomal protein L17 n=1 Tax=candidate division WS6 bacterium 36_33 TaxID=1641388 RepID=A0A101GYU0_9BACT|nr:MAG: 50S ribosomal protein L17 [candidate division WS6 bacterium 36_33]
MYKRIKRAKLGRKKSHRESLIDNLLRSLFDNNYVVTTTTKAKVLKQNAESLIEVGKKKGESIDFIRKLNNVLGKETIVKKYLEYIKKDNAGVGFVRVGFREGDNAELSRVYLLGLDKKRSAEPKSKKEDGKKKENIEKAEKNPLKIREETQVGLKKKVDKTAVVKKSGTRPQARAGL